MDAGAGSDCWNVPGRCWWQENGVNDVDDAVGSWDISGRDGGVANLHSAVFQHCKRSVCSVDHGDGQSIGDVAGSDGARVDVVEEDVC